MIFKELFNKPAFIDRYLTDEKIAVDVIIPVKTVNELFERNLLSIYKEIPVNRLIIGDAGVSDKTFSSILDRFPRITVIKQDEYKTLGYCIKQLINEVSTKYFIYLHADAFLPENWFDLMKDHTTEYDWFDSRAYITRMTEYIDKYEDNTKRAFSGAQMGLSSLLKEAVKPIEDDFLYRNEDIVIRELVEQQGGRYGKAKNLHFYHEQMGERKYNREKEIEMLTWQIRGILKYCSIKTYLVKIIIACGIDLVKAKVKR